MKPTSEFVLVTQAMAREWLKANVGNRRIAKAHLDFIKGEMSRGEWVPGVDQIVFDAAGRLIDGQHRLTAIADLGIPQEMLVVRGVAPRASGKRGTAKPWSPADRLGASTTSKRMAVEVAIFIQTVIVQPRPEKPHDSDLQRVLSWCHPIHDRLLAACSTKVAVRSAVPVRSALCVMLAAAPNAQVEEALKQYRALVICDARAMNRATAAFLKQATNNAPSLSGSVERLSLFARAWKAFKPESRDLERIVIVDPTTSLLEAREVARTLNGIAT